MSVVLDDNVMIKSLTRAAVATSNTKTLAWILYNHPEHNLVHSVIEYAAELGSVSTLEWLHDAGIELASYEVGYTSFTAARYGWIEVLRWLRRYGWKPNTSTWMAAAFHGQFGVFRYLIDLGELTTTVLRYMEVMHMAAASGNLEVCKYLRALGFCFDGDFCAEAARKKHLSILTWAIGNGCDYDAEWCRYACRRDPEICVYLDALQ